MKGRIIAIGLFVAAIATGIIFWKGRKHADKPQASQVTQPSGSSTAVGKSQQPTAALQPAKLAIAVTDAKGPLANASVRLAPDDGDPIVISTGTDGTARATDLVPGSYSISVSAPDHEPKALPDEKLAAGDDVKRSIVLDAGGRTLTGTVTDVNGGPVVGARIDAAKLGRELRPTDAIATTVTGADGKYAVSVSEGHALVAARSADYAPQTRNVEIGPDGAVADFALVPGGVVEGIVLDATSRAPIANARVIARRDGGGMLLAEGGRRRATSGADGKFRITGLRPGAYELDASTDLLRTRTPTLVGIGVAESVTDVELLVGKAVVVKGTVVDEKSAPVANVDIQVMGPGRGSDATSNAAGEFVLTGIDPGKYQVFGIGGGMISAGFTPIEVGDVDLLNVVVKMKAGQSITGHVEPRQPCEISAEPAEMNMRGGMLSLLAPTATKPDGSFTLGPVAAGKFELSARCTSGDQGALPVEIAPNLGEVTIAVKPGGSIAGTVVDAKTKQPIAGATVMAAGTAGGTRTMIVNGMVTSGVQAITNAKGAYELTGLAPNSYRLSVLDHGHPLKFAAKAPVVAVAGSEKKTGVELAVDRANGKISGVVTGPDGKPLADAWVSVHQDLEAMLKNMRPQADDDNAPEGRSTMMVQVSDDGDGGDASGFQPTLTDAQGRFSIGGLPAGAYEVLAEAQQGKLRGRQRSVTPDATITLVAAGLTTISGKVHGANGPAALFTVELDGPTRAQRSFTKGEFELGRVDPGDYTLRVHSADGNAEQKVKVIAGQPTTVDIALVANAIVTGRLVDAAGKPLGGVGVALVPDAGDGRVQISLEGPPPESAPDGKFRLEHAAGKFTLVVLGGGGRPTIKRGLVLEAGKPLDVGDVKVEQ